jgi:L-lactate dehydrogenase complex protein LldG
MSSREAILGKIRQELGAGEGAARNAAAAARIGRHNRGLMPARATGKSPDDLIALLSGYLKAQQVTILQVDADVAVPEAVAGYLRGKNLPARLRVGSDARLKAMAWTSAGLDMQIGKAQTSDEVGISRAIAGVAETGTLVLASGPANPVTVTFLPETHIVVLSRADVVAAYEDVWDRLRANGAAVMPRTVNMVSGPSRTADIASQIVTGAHGPKHLCLVLVP